MPCVFIRERAHTHTSQKKPYKDGGRDWSDAAISQGKPVIAVSHQKLRNRHETISFRAFRRNHPC